MSRTPIPDDLVRKPEEAEADAKLFDAFADLIPRYVIPIEPVWPIEEISNEEFVDLVKTIKTGLKLRPEPSLEEKQLENKEYEDRERKMIVAQIAAAIIEQLREKVEKEGIFKFPFGLVVTKSDESISPETTTTSTKKPVVAVIVGGKIK